MKYQRIVKYIILILIFLNITIHFLQYFINKVNLKLIFSTNLKGYVCKLPTNNIKSKAKCEIRTFLGEIKFKSAFLSHS